MTIHIYQIQYDDKTSANPNNKIKNFDCRENPEFLKREMAHLVRFYDEIICSNEYKETDYFALLSPKFFDKTGLMRQDVENCLIQDHYQHDIYIFNPRPLYPYRFLNVWLQGEVNHSGLMLLTDKLFAKAKYTFTPSSLHRNPHHKVSYCNYWIAKKSFYRQFISFIKHLDQCIENMPFDEKAQYFSKTQYTTEACFYPFIFERLLTTYLYMYPEYQSQSYSFKKDNANVFKRCNRLEMDFYLNSHKEIFDHWEKTLCPESKIISQEIERLNYYFYPKFPLKFLASMIKKISKIQINNIMNKKVKEINLLK